MYNEGFVMIYLERYATLSNSSYINNHMYPLMYIINKLNNYDDTIILLIDNFGF